MSYRTRLIAAALAAGSGIVSTSAMATGLYHPAPTEAGVTVHPDHVSSTRTNEQVVAELSAAMRSPAWSSISRGAPWPTAAAATPRTRADVQNEAIEALRAGQIPYGETR